MNKYRHTKKGLISVIYSAQITHSKRRNHNLPTYTKLELTEWIYSQIHFNRLFNIWVNSGYKTELKPSIDRIDDYKGYSLDNIALTIWKKNKEKGHFDIKNGINTKTSRSVLQYDKEQNLVKEWHSMMEAERSGYDSGHIAKCCKNQRKTHGGYIWKYKEEK